MLRSVRGFFVQSIPLNSRETTKSMRRCAFVVSFTVSPQHSLHQPICKLALAYLTPLQFEKLRNSFEEEWKRVLVQYEEDFGPRVTSWEQLFDTEHRKRFYFNSRTGQRHDEQEIAICESCDSLIAGDDFKCLVCGSKRSEINRKRYKGRVPLDEMIKADREAFSLE
mmetsp:Transcript_56130/g.168018  ORF Transcript_56130/g.168018 Transcript_56130/m.168018 type:complete len:167 (+) Transcript_56130:681-1181(+)